MKVFECKIDGERCLIGVSRKYLKIVTKNRTVDIEQVSATEIKGDRLFVVIEGQKDHLQIEGLERKDLENIQETVKSKRMISKEEIAEAIKKNIQLQKTYKNINQKEHKIFYKIFGEILLKTVRKEESTNLDQKTSSEKARFILSNRTAITAYFRMNISFSLFVGYFYGGFLMIGAAENEVDEEVFKIHERPISPVERINVRSMILQDSVEEPEEIKQKTNTQKKDHLINPDLVRLLNEKFLNRSDLEKESVPLLRREKIVAQPPRLTVRTIKPLRRVGIPIDILRRMKEVSRLIYKNKNASDEIRDISNSLQQSLKEEIRRKLPIEEGDAVMMAIGRIVPTRFIDKLNTNPLNK